MKPQPLYKIGAVSNITGLTPHLIRAWERRYGLDIAQRSEGGTRLYTEKGITLLALLRDLINKGDAIGEVANLSEEELRERLKIYGQAPEKKAAKEPVHRTESLTNSVRSNSPENDSKRLFSDEKLMQLSQLSSGLDCNYLKSVAFALFEINSLENRFRYLSETLTTDKGFYSNLHEKTNQARACLESILKSVCSNEGLKNILEADHVA